MPLARTLILAATAALAAAAPAAAADRVQHTKLISHAMDGGLPNGPSTHSVISNDRRYARAIAFESEASNLVPGDSNGVKDLFVVLRAGKIDNFGVEWTPGPTRLVSRGHGGAPANGPSWGAAIGGGFYWRPKCIGFLSSASNIARRDTNGVDDAFVARLSRRGTLSAPRRVSLPRGRQSSAPATAIAVSGDCKALAFVSGGRLYHSLKGRRAKRVKAPGIAADPSFSTGRRRDLVFGAANGVYLKRQESRRARLVAPGGRNPAYNDIKRQVVTYERHVGGRSQIGYKDLGDSERIISSHRGDSGDGDSRDPVIGNSGYYVTFESEAENLGLNALARTGDENERPDVYLFTDVRDITLVQSVVEKAVPLDSGGRHPSMSFYANYVTFDAVPPRSRAVIGLPFGLLAQPGLPSSQQPPQVFMRWLGEL